MYINGAVDIDAIKPYYDDVKKVSTWLEIFFYDVDLTS
jgi:hypothetical protein